MKTPHQSPSRSTSSRGVPKLLPRSRRRLTFAAPLFAAIMAWQPLVSVGAGNPPPNASLSAVANGGQFELHLHGQANKVYQIEASTNLTDWTVVAQRTGGPGTVSIPDPAASQLPFRYYRVAPLKKHGVATLDTNAYAPDKILFKPKAGMSSAVLGLNPDVQVLHVFPGLGNLHVAKVSHSSTVGNVIAQYVQSGMVEYAEPDYYVHAQAVPNDQYYQWLWGFHNTNQFGGVAGADIDAQDAWDIRHDAGNIIVAVVDTGIRYTHEDLAANMWHNPQENQDGYVNDLYGINVTTNGRGNGDPWDDYGHGSHCAGIIGAVGNNSLGVVGVAWHVQLMACKFLDPHGIGTLDGAITCLDFARTHGANVVNASWGLNEFKSQALHDAIANLRDAGIIFVAAAGNDNQNDDDPTQAVYPAAYSDLNNVIAVAATDQSDNLASFSAFGATSVDLGAPGVTIGSCWNGSDSDYEYDDGTSQATAMVSGAVALVEAGFPNETYQQIRQQIFANVDQLPSLQGKCASGGRLNLHKALLNSAPPPPVNAAFTYSPASGTAPLTVQFTDTSSGNVTNWNWNFGDGATDTVENPSHTYSSTGSFTATLIVTGNNGQTSSLTQTITVTNGASELPVINLTAIFPDAYAAGEVPGTVNFHRTGDTTQNYEVYWTFSGTAVNGVDFGPLPTNSPFPNGDDARLTITPIDHGQTNDTTVIVTLASGPSYQIGVSNSATIIIHGHQTSQPTSVSASFNANPKSGQAPLAVQFTDQSSGPVTGWNWSFGDGASSTAQNPSHTYNSAGSFTATLTASGNSGQTSSASQTITVTNAPASVNASFTPDATSGQAPLTVQFTDHSSGPVTHWNWSFGDGASDTAQNPSHTYTSAGSYTATLTASGSSGQTSSASQTITVTNAPPPVPTVRAKATHALATSVTPGVFEISRTGSTDSDLTVNYTLSGSAQNGVDYQALSGVATIPAGSSSTTLIVQPIQFLTVLKSVILTVSPSTTYDFDAPPFARVDIVASVSL